MSHNFPKFQHLLLACLMAGMADVAEAGSVQFSTYYPAPFGMYDRLRLVPRADLGGTCDAATQTGTLYVEEVTGALTYCNISGTWGPLSGGPWTQDVNGVWVTDTTANVGIGTTTPSGTLDVDGGTPAGIANGTNITIKAQDGGVVAGTGGSIILMPGSGGGGGGSAGGVGIGTSNLFGGVLLGVNGSALFGNFNDISVAGGVCNIFDIQSLLNAPNRIYTLNGLRTDGLIHIETGNLFVETGNVGIGTATPTSRLHVDAPEGYSPAGVFFDNTDINVNGSTDGEFMIRNNSASGTQKIFLTGSSGATPVLTVDGEAGNVGIGTTTPRTKLELGNDGAILAAGTSGSGWTEPNLGAGTRLFWYPRKEAFRVGRVIGTQWNDANIGAGSIAMGPDTIASQWNAVAIGEGANATGPESVAISSAGPTTSSGISSIAIGAGVTSSGTISTAIGAQTTASGNSATAMGDLTTASGVASTAMGADTTASGDYSTAMNVSTTAQAYASTVLGKYNVISGSTGVWNNTDPLFVIGNGASAASPSNAMTVLKSGNVGIGTTNPGTNRLEVVGGPIKATGGLIIPTCTIAAGDCPAPPPVDGQIWLCTDC